MRLVLAIAALALLVAAALPAEARIQRDLVCWVPDWEFPVDCDEDGD